MMSGFLSAEETLVLDTDRIQGNALVGFKADHQHFVGMRIDRPGEARKWLAGVAEKLTSAEEVASHRGHCGEAETGPAPKEPWVNLALGHPAVKAIEYPGEFDDTPFEVGMEARIGILGDRKPAGSDWKVGGGNPIDVLLVVAAAEEEEAAKAVEELVRSAAGLSAVYTEAGATLSRRGHEHFGFRDGISQPGALGRYKHDRECPITRRDWTVPPPGDGAIEATPGTSLIWPGEFVFGYPGQGTAPRLPDPPRHAADGGREWTDNGSLLVFRRLRQDVAAFRRFCREQARALDESGEWSGMTPELLAALIVGRWPSGAPVDASVTADPSPGADPARNDFDFSDDLRGGRCPLDAHIRKVNPRDGETDVTPAVRRILRRGIPYGSELAAGADADDKVDRGLLFLCYQTSIDSQFEAITHDWMNSENRPFGRGHDVLVGQRLPSRRLSLLHPGDRRAVEIQVDVDWIVPTGGAYLFAPPIDALAGL